MSKITTMPAKDKQALIKQAMENQGGQQEESFVVHPLMVLDDSSPEKFKGATMGKAFFRDLYQTFILLKTRAMQNEVTGVQDPVIVAGAEILSMFLNQTTFELIQEGAVKKYSAETWAAQETIIIDAMKAQYEKLQTEQFEQEQEAVKEVEVKEVPKIYMSEDELND